MKCDPKITNKAAENRQSMQALLGHVELKGIRVPQSAMLICTNWFRVPAFQNTGRVMGLGLVAFKIS